MSLQPHIIDFFENLPHLALSEICKHLELTIDKLILSVVSDKFNQSISLFKFNIYDLIVKIIDSEANVRINHQEIDTNWYVRLVFDSERRGYKWSTDKTTLIAYKTGSKTAGIRRFLENCTSLKEKQMVSHIYLEIDDSTWMKREDLLKFQYRKAKIDYSKFCEEDINAFLKHWTVAGLEKTSARHLEFQVRRDFQMEKVLEGLEPKRWDPKRRDRKFILHDDDLKVLEPLDLSEGHDITGKNIMATVHLVDDKLHFCVWLSRFWMEDYIGVLETTYVIWDRNLSSGEMDFEDTTWPEKERLRCWMGLKVLANRQYEWGTGSGKYDVIAPRKA